MPRELPDNWEDIDVKRMLLPKSKKSRRRRSQRRRPRPKLAAALAGAMLKHGHGHGRVARKAACEDKENKKRRKQKKNRQHQSFKKWCAYDDVVVERKPVYTKHAKERLAQGRCGEFVTAKKDNAVVIITILPQGEGPRKRMANIHIRENRKNRILKYKVR